MAASSWSGILDHTATFEYNWSNPQTGMYIALAAEHLFNASGERIVFTNKTDSAAFSDINLGDANFLFSRLLENFWSTSFSTYRDLNSVDLETWGGDYSAPNANSTADALVNIETFLGEDLTFFKDLWDAMQANGDTSIAFFPKQYISNDLIKKAFLIISSLKEYIKVPVRANTEAISISSTNNAFVSANYNVQSLASDSPLVAAGGAVGEAFFFAGHKTEGGGPPHRKLIDNSEKYCQTTGFNEGVYVPNLSPVLHGLVGLSPFKNLSTSSFNDFSVGLTIGEKLTVTMADLGTYYAGIFFNEKISADVAAIAEALTLDTEEGFRISHPAIVYPMDFDGGFDYYTP